MNKEIEEKVLEIVNYIKNSNSYKNYLKACELLNKNQELLTLIENIKKYQKEIVRNKEKKVELEKQINEKLAILNSDPIYLEYINYQDEVNNMLIIFENKINKYFYDVFN